MLILLVLSLPLRGRINSRLPNVGVGVGVGFHLQEIEIEVDHVRKREIFSDATKNVCSYRHAPFCLMLMSVHARECMES